MAAVTRHKIIYKLEYGWKDEEEGGRTAGVQGTRCVAQNDFSFCTTDLLLFFTGFLNPYPLFSAPTQPADIAETLETPPLHVPAPPPKSKNSTSTNSPETIRRSLLGVFWVPEHIYDIAGDSRRRLYLELDTCTTFTSYPRFRTQTPAPEYAGIRRLYHELDAITTRTCSNPIPDALPVLKYARQPTLAYFGLLDSFLESEGCPDLFFPSIGLLATPSFLHLPPSNLEATTGSLDANFAAYGYSCKMDTAGMGTSMKEVSDVSADTTIVFDNPENPRMVILKPRRRHYRRACDSINDYLEATRRAEGIGRRRESGRGIGYQVTWPNLPPPQRLRCSSSSLKRLKNPPPHPTPPKSKSTYPTPTDPPKTSRGPLLRVLQSAEHAYDIAEDSQRRLSLEFDMVRPATLRHTPSSLYEIDS
ncbi:hypothetical protein Moror_9542 [Moniliophthora roreri MCA 2997]|uniref:Uncharacterized protein n=1 Tax=Moniliophthora roreri (strain MCA 2997) TaxID=1381753 RepID=V2YHJ1_MONRO|nr:hypothetical protein Moror_9542 [Moniliophthora roreri MCA 2997]